ncbi:MAG TPA: hypothetical protein VGN52_07555, partial [Burkholderiales bacterium]
RKQTVGGSIPSNGTIRINNLNASRAKRENAGNVSPVRGQVQSSLGAFMDFHRRHGRVRAHSARSPRAACAGGIIAPDPTLQDANPAAIVEAPIRQCAHRLSVGDAPAGATTFVKSAMRIPPLFTVVRTRSAAIFYEKPQVFSGPPGFSGHICGAGGNDRPA